MAQNYTFRLTRAGQAEPEVLAVVVSGDARARSLARELLGRSPDRLALEAWRDDRLLFELLAEDAGTAP